MENAAAAAVHRRAGTVLLAAALVVPVFLILLFELLKRNRALMDAWVFGGMRKLEQGFSFLWGLQPLSGMEVLIVLVVLFHLVWIFAGIVPAVWHRRWRQAGVRVLVIAALWLWVLAGLEWLWNAAYCASGFQERSGLTAREVSAEELAAVTRYYGENAGRLADQVKRNEEGLFAEDRKDLFTRAEHVYENLTREYPCLEAPVRRAKPLICSRLQSMLGFTGIYFPFTGEANVNVDQPMCLVPATIAHEMAHQRMIASELECNFVGTAACITSDDPAFQYSGYLMGLIHLCNALYPSHRNAWKDIAGDVFTKELAADWNDNNTYWAELSSPAETAAESVYDSYLKSNDQELGIRSYGAYVDLLVTYTLEHEDLEIRPLPEEEV